MTIAIIIGAIFLLLILFALQGAKNTVTGVCPKCNTRIGLLKGIGCCPHCGETLRNEAGKYAEVEAGFIADNPVFITNLSKLKPVASWIKTWDGQCCVCGKTAIKKQDISIKTITGQVGSLLAPMNTTRTGKFEVGYCNAHTGGIRFSFPPGIGRAKHKSECLLGFRSVDYYRDFFNQNRISSQTVRD